VLEVHFIHARPAHERAYEDTFGAPVRFHMPRSGILVAARWLDRPMPHSRPDVLAVVEHALGRLVDAKSPGIRGRVASIVTAQLPTGRMSMGSVAREMRMSVSTLARRLGDEGARFGEIVDGTRRTMADTLLRRPQRSVGEIAALVGFSHVSAFHTAFRRWTGMSPTDYRAHLERIQRIP
jgi:AraC-like DNA-binding protein